MKANRKFIGEERAVSAVIGVILMVAITVAIAATVYLYVSGMITGGSSITPTVSFSQVANNNYLMVSGVEHGPVPKNVSIIFTNSSGGKATYGDITDTNSNNKLDAGDIIKPHDNLQAGETYTVTIIYAGKVIGSAKFTYYG
ncbi:MAG: type IV pilin [Thermoplasmata archaeon]|nr:type IV pilin [Thermoplasmata archaeon]